MRTILLFTALTVFGLSSEVRSDSPDDALRKRASQYYRARLSTYFIEIGQDPEAQTVYRMLSPENIHIARRMGHWAVVSFPDLGMADGFTRNSELWIQKTHPAPWRWIKCTEPYCTTFLVPLQNPQEPAVLIIGGCCGGTRYRVYLTDPAESFKLVDQGETYGASYDILRNESCENFRLRIDKGTQMERLFKFDCKTKKLVQIQK